MNFRFFKFSLYLLIAIFSFSCAKDSDLDNDEETGVSTVQDQYNYIALRNDGTLFSIGDTSGVVTSIGQISGLEFNTVFNTVTSSQMYTYIYEAGFDPPQGRLFMLNRNSGDSEKRILDFPEEFGNNPGIMSLDWDEANQNLVGVVRQEFEAPNFGGPLNIVRINPETLEFTVLEDIDLYTQGYKGVLSSQLVGQKLYVSASKDNEIIHADLLEINLTEKTFRVLPQEGVQQGILNLGWIPGTQKLLGFSPNLNSEYMGAVRPYIYDIENESMEEIGAELNISAVQFTHKTFYNSEIDKFIGLIGKGGFNLFSFDPAIKKFSFTPIDNPEDLSTMIGIIGVVKL